MLERWGRPSTHKHHTFPLPSCAEHRAYIKACFLIDPVDGSSQSPASDPSAAAALAAAGAAVGMSSAGRIGSCNPRASGSLAFWAAAGPGSWNSVLPNANHACFAQAGWLLNHAFDLLCGRSGVGREAAQQLATVPMLTWLWDSLSQVWAQGGREDQAQA